MQIQIPKPKIVAVIPAFNEERTIGVIIKETKKYVDEVIVVDDGSTDQTAQIICSEGTEVYRHIINRGLGASLGTGFKAALKSGAGILITLDADGQHNPEDIPRLVEPLTTHLADVTIGSRFIENQSMLLSRKLYNIIANCITFILFKTKTTDSQSGFRAFNRKALEAINLQTSRMEVSSEIMKEIGLKKLRLVEIPIKAIYTNYSLSKGQNFINGIKTFFKLILLKLVK